MLSVERQAGTATVLSASYVGNMSHHQRVLIEPNPGDPAVCLSLSQPNEVTDGVTCGAGGEDQVYHPVTGGVVNGTRVGLGPNFGSNALQSTIGNASYNALELSARHTSKRLENSAAYTFSKSLDQSSNIAEEVNPINPKLSRGLSAFDVRHNFVVSYEYQLPVDLLFAPNRLTTGWSLSGITHIASGFPVTMVNNGDNSLLGTNPNGINNSSIDEPDYNGGSLHLNHQPRGVNAGGVANVYFDAGVFSENALGTPGTSRRRFFSGPGGANFDLAVAKDLRLTESRALMFRMEAFNLFNHAQFNGPTSVDGDIGSSTFGNVIAAQPARVLQGAVKFRF